MAACHALSETSNQNRGSGLVKFAVTERVKSQELRGKKVPDESCFWLESHTIPWNCVELLALGKNDAKMIALTCTNVYKKSEMETVKTREQQPSTQHTFFSFFVQMILGPPPMYGHMQPLPWGVYI